MAADFDRDDLSAFEIIPPRLAQSSDAHEVFFDAVGTCLHDLFAERFVLPELDDGPRVFYFYAEVANMFYTIFFDRHYTLTDRCLDEAKCTGKAYFLRYLPLLLPTRSKIIEAGGVDNDFEQNLILLKFCFATSVANLGEQA